MPQAITKRQGFPQAIANALPEILKNLGPRDVTQDDVNTSIGKITQQSATSNEDHQALQAFVRELLASFGTVQIDGMLDDNSLPRAVTKRQAGLIQVIEQVLPDIFKSLGLRDISRDSRTSSFNKRQADIVQAIANALPDILENLGLRDVTQDSLNTSLDKRNPTPENPASDEDDPEADINGAISIGGLLGRPRPRSTEAGEDKGIMLACLKRLPRITATDLETELSDGEIVEKLEAELLKFEASGGSTTGKSTKRDNSAEGRKGTITVILEDFVDTACPDLKSPAASESSDPEEESPENSSLVPQLIILSPSVL
jgi:hypothetical protein